MNKDALIAKFQGKTGHSKKDATICVEALLDSIVEGLEEDGIVDITKAFKLEVKETKERTARNPQTGEPVQVPAGKRIGFKPLKRLSQIVGK